MKADGVLSRLRAWEEERPGLVCFLAGLATASALPPLYLLPGLLGLTEWYRLSLRSGTVRQAALGGWSFGFGFFLGGLYWVGIAFFADAERFAVFAVPAVLLLTAGLALFPAVIAALMRWARRLPPLLHAFLFALLWTVSELLRGEWLLQFPWNPLAIVWTVSDLTLQPVAWLGTAVFGLLTLFALVLPVAIRRKSGWRGTDLLPIAVLVGLILASGALRLAGADGMAAGGPTVRVVQPNIAQHHKWQEEKQLAWFRRHLELTRRPWKGAPPALIVWPESSVPYEVEREDVRAAIAEVLPRGSYLLLGADRYARQDGRLDLTNSVYLLDDRGAILGRYDKVNLVPFGEYLPFRSILSRIGFKKLTRGTLDFRPGTGRTVFTPEGLPPLSPLICFEAAFPGRATDGSRRARLLVNVTNDAWFGRSSGPYQHFAMARMRAVESGLPLVRAANTGISAVVDAYGEVRAHLPLDTGGVLDAVLPPAIAPPLFARHPRLPWLLVVVLAGMVWVVDRMRGRTHTTPMPPGPVPRGDAALPAGRDAAV